MKKGVCGRKTSYLGVVTVTDKGQIAIPMELRQQFKINKGDKLLVVKRRDNKGFNLLKMDIIGDFINKISNN